MCTSRYDSMGRRSTKAAPRSTAAGGVYSAKVVRERRGEWQKRQSSPSPTSPRSIDPPERVEDDDGSPDRGCRGRPGPVRGTRPRRTPPPASGRLSLIHISEPTRLRRISYAVFCLKKKKKKKTK